MSLSRKTLGADMVQNHILVCPTLSVNSGVYMLKGYMDVFLKLRQWRGNEIKLRAIVTLDVPVDLLMD